MVKIKDVYLLPSGIPGSHRPLNETQIIRSVADPDSLGKLKEFKKGFWKSDLKIVKLRVHMSGLRFRIEEVNIEFSNLLKGL